jgi:universal stress protein A
MAKLKKVLIAIDFSQPSREALEVGLDLATEAGAKVSVLYVVEPIDYASIGYLGGVPMATQSILDAHLAAARKEMERFRARKLARFPGATALIRIGHPADEIVAVGGGGRSNLIVVGTHGRSGMAHLLLGSVAERVVRRARCPVLVVPGRARAAKR